MRYAQMIERIVELAGLQQASEAERAVEATLPSFAEILAADDVEALRLALPEPAARWLRSDTPRFPPDAEALYGRVAERSGLGLGFAREQAQAVLAAMAEIADASAVQRVRRHVPPSLRGLLEDPHRGLSAPHEPGAPGATSTIASGRPGSRHPLSEARPDTAHSQSVARSDDPHRETRLSSAQGLTQERLDDSLASSRPGSTRPLAEGRR